MALAAGALSVGLVACSPAQSGTGPPSVAPSVASPAPPVSISTPPTLTTAPSTTTATVPVAAGARMTPTVSGGTAVAKLVTSTGIPAAGKVTLATTAFSEAKPGSSISATVGSDSIRYGDQITVEVSARATTAPAGADLTGHVVLRDGGSIAAEGDTDAAGHASLVVLNRADPGVKTYTVAYAGTPAVAASSTDLTVHTTRTNVDIAISWPDGLLPKADAAIGVDIVGTPDSPTGVATMSADGKQIAKGRVDADGKISGTASALGAGDHQIEVSYAGDARFEPNTASATLTVTEPIANPNAAGAAAAQAGNPCPAAASACVDLSGQQAWLQTGGKITYGPVPMTSGREGHRTGTGMFSVFWLDKDHKSSLFDDAPMPNSVFFDDGIAFHEGSLSDQSHGCIHLSWDASETFFDTLAVGDGVYVWGAPPY